MNAAIYSKQLPLAMWLPDGIGFDNFLSGPNAQLVSLLANANQQPENHFIFLWGGNGVGKSHLLQAACHQMAGQGSVYLPMRQAIEFAPEMLEGMEQLSLVAIDDLDAVAGHTGWELALFNLYNRMRDSGTARLLVSAEQPLASLGIKLPDLQSRLAWGGVYQLQSLTDQEKLIALQQRANNRGFELPDEVGNYLLRHYQRNMGALFVLLEKLDHVSLAEQRRLTIPFVKTVIAEQAV